MNQVVDDENLFLTKFKERMYDMYLQEWLAQVELTSDNRLFKHIKYKFEFESYLELNNHSMRVSIAKIRLSSNIFYIERGRWGQNRVPVEERRCNVCNEIEDEYHCLIKCPHFNNERIGLLPGFLYNSPNRDKFLAFISTKSLQEQKKLGLLCLKILKSYRELL